MATPQELPVQPKREAEKKQERTVPSAAYLPATDIFETDQALTVIMEMPGVRKENVEINVENDVITVEVGSISRNMTVSGPSIRNTMSATMSAAFSCRARSSRAPSVRS